VEGDLARMCELFVGFPDVTVLGDDDDVDGPLPIHIESRARRPECSTCGVPVRVKDRPVVALVDLPAFGDRRVPSLLLSDRSLFRTRHHAQFALDLVDETRKIKPGDNVLPASRSEVGVGRPPPDEGLNLRSDGARIAGRN